MAWLQPPLTKYLETSNGNSRTALGLRPHHQDNSGTLIPLLSNQFNDLARLRPPPLTY